jgi:hypothetical protein
VGIIYLVPWKADGFLVWFRGKVWILRNSWKWAPALHFGDFAVVHKLLSFAGNQPVSAEGERYKFSCEFRFSGVITGGTALSPSRFPRKFTVFPQILEMWRIAPKFAKRRARAQYRHFVETLSCSVEGGWFACLVPRKGFNLAPKMAILRSPCIPAILRLSANS